MPFYDGRILNDPTITRRLIHTTFGPLELQEVTVELDNMDGALTGDPRGVSFAMDIFDATTLQGVDQWAGVVSSFSRSRGRATLTGTNFDFSVLEQEVPLTGLVTAEQFPLALDIGTMIPLVFGNVMGVPCRYIREDLVTSQFDYAPCQGDATLVAGIVGAARLGPNNTRVPIQFEECEPPPYDIAVPVGANLKMELWSGGAAVPPDSWSLEGAGATVAQATAAGFFDEGLSAAALTRNGTTCALIQNIESAAPLSWWEGRNITVTARVRATVADRARVVIYDGLGATPSAFHGGTGGFSTLTVTRKIAVGASIVQIYLYVTNGDTTAWFDNIKVRAHAKSWAEAAREDLYAGLIVLRMIQRQVDGSGSPYALVADVHGYQAERNPIQASATILTALGLQLDQAALDVARITVAGGDYLARAIVDRPEVLLLFNDVLSSTIALDSSGHDRHGTYVNRTTTQLDGIQGVDAGDVQTLAQAQWGIDGYDDANGRYVELADDPAYSPTAFNVVLSYTPLSFSTTDGSQAALAAKTVGGAHDTQWTLSQVGVNIRWAVRTSDGLFAVTVDPTLTGGVRYTIVATAGGGVLGLYIETDAGLRFEGTASYTGTLTTGTGPLYIGRFGDGATNPITFTTMILDNFGFYSGTLTEARRLAHTTYNSAVVETPPQSFLDVVTGGDGSEGAIPVPKHVIPLAETSGALLHDHENNVIGAINGTPLYNLPGPYASVVPRNTNVFDPEGGALGFRDDLTAYATFANTELQGVGGNAGAVLCFFRPMGLDTGGAVYSIVENSVGGVNNTSYLLAQNGPNLIWRVCGAPANTVLRLNMDAGDVGKWMMVYAEFQQGVQRIFKNGTLVNIGQYSTTVGRGAGTVYIGRRPTSGPLSGDVKNVVIWDGADTGLTPEQVSAIYVAATWRPGGLLADAALTEPRQAQEWLRQFFLLRNVRLGTSSRGTVTMVVDTAGGAPSVTLRSGTGDGAPPNLRELQDRQRPPLKNVVRDYVLRYRKDFLTGEFTRERRRAVSTLLVKPENWLINSSFESWTAGATAPDWWGAGSPGEQDQTSVLFGQSSLRATRAGADVLMAQSRSHQLWRMPWVTAGETVTLGCWVYATVGGAATIWLGVGNVIGTTFYPAAYHSGSGQWEFLTVTHTILAGEEDLFVAVLVIENTDTTAWFDGAILAKTATLLDWHAEPAVGETAARVGTDFVDELDVVRSDIAADRIADYRGKYLAADETVTAVVEPGVAVGLFEGMRVTVIDPLVGYAGETLIVRNASKQGAVGTFLLGEDPVDAYTYTAAAFPLGEVQEI